MTGLTKECTACDGRGQWTLYRKLGRVELHPCRACDATGRIPITETELEAHGQERLPL